MMRESEFQSEIPGIASSAAHRTQTAQTRGNRRASDRRLSFRPNVMRETVSELSCNQVGCSPRGELT